MTAEDPGSPGGKAPEDRMMPPASTGPPDDADNPAWREPTAAVG